MTSNTIWLSDDEDIDLLEYYELLEEARKDVDRKYTRGDQQPALIQSFMAEGARGDWRRFNMWSDSHFLMFYLKREFVDD